MEFTVSPSHCIYQFFLLRGRTPHTHSLLHSFLSPPLPQETVLCKVLQCESLPWAAFLHKLKKLRSPPQGTALQEQAPTWIPHEVTSPASKYAIGWAPLFMAPGWASHRVTVSCRHPSAPVGVIQGLDLCSSMDLHGL